jgi:hypothetical protein
MARVPFTFTVEVDAHTDNALRTPGYMNNAIHIALTDDATGAKATVLFYPQNGNITLLDVKEANGLMYQDAMFFNIGQLLLEAFKQMLDKQRKKALAKDLS